MADEPIIPQDYISGMKVVDIGDLRVARGQTRRPASSCRHNRTTYDPKERRIWCQDCEKDVDPFDAFVLIAEHFHFAEESLRRRKEAMAEAEAFQIRTLAGKALEKAWRKRNMMPSCPYCKNGLFPEDFKAGVSMISVEYATARRTKWLADKETKKP